MCAKKKKENYPQNLQEAKPFPNPRTPPLPNSKPQPPPLRFTPCDSDQRWRLHMACGPRQGGRISPSEVDVLHLCHPVASGGVLIAAVRTIDLPVTVSPSLDASIIFELYVPSISVFTFQCDTSAMSCFASILNPRSSILLLVREYTLRYGSILC